MMELDEAIKHCEEKAEEQKQKAKLYKYMAQEVEACEDTRKVSKYIHSMEEFKEIEAGCLECAKEHEQLAEWLKDYKRLKERPQGEWIAVSERLPEKEGKCLVTTDFGDVCEDSFVDGIFVLYLGNVIAWQPLPEPYEKGGAE